MVDENDSPALPGTDPREAVQRLLRTIRRNGLQVAFTTIVCVMLGTALSMIWPNKYESMTQFVLREQNIIDDSAILGDLEDIPLPTKLRTLEYELRSHKRISAVLDELQWVEYLETSSSPARKRDFIIKVGANLDVSMEPDPTGAKNITLAFQWTDPRKAMDFVNRLRDHWISLTVEAYRKNLNDQLERGEEIVSARERDYLDALHAVRQFEQENDTPSLLSVEVNQEQQGELEVELVNARAGLDAAVGKVEQLTALLDVVPRTIEVTVPPENPEQAALMKELAAARTKLQSQKELYTPTHPKVVSAEKIVADLEQQLEAAGGVLDLADLKQTVTNPDYVELVELIEEAEQDELRFAALVDEHEKSLAQVKSRLQRLPKINQELDRLNAEAEHLRQQLNLARAEVRPLRERVKHLRSAEMSPTSGYEILSGSPFEILDLGVEPEDPVLPIAPVILALSLMLGVGVGVALPLLIEIMRSSFSTASDVTRVLGLPVLGTVDLILTARDVRARAIQRTLTVMTMLLIIAALGMALYIYAFHQDRLPATVIRQLRELRMALT